MAAHPQPVIHRQASARRLGKRQAAQGVAKCRGNTSLQGRPLVGECACKGWLAVNRSSAGVRSGRKVHLPEHKLCGTHAGRPDAQAVGQHTAVLHGW